MNEIVIAKKVAKCFVAKKRPDDLFAGIFFDIREKAKSLKEDLSSKAQVHISNTLTKDLVGRGIGVQGLKVSLGSYRGSKFITSAKFDAILKTKSLADNLLKYLQSKYSPKYKIKGIEERDDGSVIVSFNIR